MRNLQQLKAYRVPCDDAPAGTFFVPSPIDQKPMLVIADLDQGWGHVSVSRRDRDPIWTEMEYVKRIFFHDDEVVVQFYLPMEQNIGERPFCLRLWQPIMVDLPMPPALMAGLETKVA